ncbi:response regulator [Muricauda sp. TY007]|uniref:response regulator n=1 Tax=Allomuricauda sp. TY007 TaxID=2683200 RepID=UPI0013C18C78|nr:response regulator [Muricauda sp. TY007]NDV17012.1 response regulator [Muricauda sp. TY007]
MEKTIILVDDDPTFNWVSSKLIKKVSPDLKVIEFSNGREALDFLQDNFNEKDHYTILLDINMPEMNGWEFMNAIEQSDWVNSKSISVYIVSSSTDPSDMETAKTYGLIKDYLQKPLSFDVVTDIVSR